MSSRIVTIKGKSGFYLEVDKPSWLRKLKGGANSVKRKAGATRAEATRNALKLEAEILQEWDLIQEQNPLKAAKGVAKAEGLDLDDALEELMRNAGWSRERREAVLMTLIAEPADLKKQGLTPELDQETRNQITSLQSDVDTWQEWVKVRRLEERNTAASTIANWETKLRGLAQWLGTDHVGVLTKEQAHSYKLLMIQKEFSDNSIRNYIGAFSGMWNWAIRSGKLDGKNVWEGLKKGLGSGKKREALDPEVLADAEKRADRDQDVRFWIGRYQGLRKEDYCGLRWSDIDTTNKVIHLQRYEWKGQKRNLKLKEGGERTVPIHSKLMVKLEKYLPEAFTNNTVEPIWPTDYKPKLESWGSRFAERFTDRYGFGSHDLRSYVVTQMLKVNINPYFLKEITGHSVPGLGKVVAGYTAPTIEEAREVLEQLN